MKWILSILNKYWKEKFLFNTDMFDECFINYCKDKIEWVENFLQRLIDNWHIEEIESESKSWPTVNDYIKYIAATDDPIKTLSDMIK